MLPKKEDKLIIKQGKHNSNVIWIGMKAYQIIEDDILMFACGGIEVAEETELVESFIKRNKKSYFKYETVEPREWSEITFGKFKGQKLDVIKDIEPKYLRWLLENSADEKLKIEIKELLKIK